MSSYVPLLLLLVALVFKTVRACGGLFCENARPVIQRGEAIVFGVKGNTVEMHVQILYEGPADAFSWILPIPYQPQVDVGSDVLFSALFQQTMPSFQLDIRNQESATCSNEALISNCFSKNNTMAFPEDAEMDTTEDGAIVLEMGSVGPYDFVILEAAENDPSSVLRWLEENDYDQPEGTGPLLNYYAVQSCLCGGEASERFRVGRYPAIDSQVRDAWWRRRRNGSYGCSTTCHCVCSHPVDEGCCYREHAHSSLHSWRSQSRSLEFC